MAEHAVSILLELPNGCRWLVDTSATNVYIENARRMNASLNNLTGIPYLAGLATGFMWPSSVDWKVAWYRPVGTILFFLRLCGGAYACYSHTFVK